MDSRVILTVLLLANMVAPQLALPAQNEWDELEGLLHDQSVESKPKAMQKAEVEQDLVEVACIVYADTGERECYPLELFILSQMQACNLIRKLYWSPPVPTPLWGIPAVPIEGQLVKTVVLPTKPSGLVVTIASTLGFLFCMGEILVAQEIVPFYHYWNGVDNFYTYDETEIGTTTPGFTGNYGYQPQGITCQVLLSPYGGTVALYRYWNGNDHFYTANPAEVGTTTPGEIGNYGYRSEGIAAFCYPSQLTGSIVVGSTPLYRYRSNDTGIHFYTTDAGVIGTTVPGQEGNFGYVSEGIVCWVGPSI